MAEKLDNKNLVTMDELSLSNAWELEALVEVLITKGAMTKQEVLAVLTELRRRNPRAAAPHNELSVDPHKTDVLIAHIFRDFQFNRPYYSTSQRRSGRSPGPRWNR